MPNTLCSQPSGELVSVNTRLIYAGRVLYSKHQDAPVLWILMKTMRIPVVSPINAGRGIPDDYGDWEITGFRDVRVVDGNDATAKYIAVPVEGESLESLNIVHGDMLICKITETYEPGKIGLWQTPSGRTAKFALCEGGEFVTLHNNNGWHQDWHRNEIKLLGVVMRIERDV